MKISEIKSNNANPRTISKANIEKLKKSINEFSKMMELRPIIIDEDNIILGGNMRYQALKELGYKELPDNWIKKITNLTPEEKKEFIIKDNTNFGAWDWDNLANEWELPKLDDWGVNLYFLDKETAKASVEQKTKNDIPDKEFEKEFERIDDTNCVHPIVPEVLEKHTFFIIPTHNEIDEQFIRNVFGLTEKVGTDKNPKDRRLSNVISMEKFNEVWEKLKS